MTDATFSVVTSIYTVGGLTGSMAANVAMDRLGRRGASKLSAAMTALGALLMAVSSSVVSLLVGRSLYLSATIGSCVERYQTGHSSGLVLVLEFVWGPYICQKLPPLRSGAA